TRSSTWASMSMPPRLDRWTIGHNIRTIDLYRPEGPRNRSWRGGPPLRAATICQRQMEEPRPCWKRLSLPSDYVCPTCQQEYSMRNILLSAATVLLAGSTLVGSAHSAELPKGAAHNIVLVHGAFVDQTSWQPVADILSKKGYNVTLVENPLTSLAADVEATKQALAKQNGKTVLVGHSWGGVVITQAGDDPKVSALVYVSALAPDVGQSMATLSKSGPVTEGAAAVHPDDKGNLYIDPKVFPSAVAADLPLKIAESLANHQLPLSVKAYEAPVDIAAWRDKP